MARRSIMSRIKERVQDFSNCSDRHGKRLGVRGCWLLSETDGHMEWNESATVRKARYPARMDGEPIHRLVYALCFGPIPEAKHIVRVCGHNMCVRPEHLLMVMPTGKYLEVIPSEQEDIDASPYYTNRELPNANRRNNAT